MTPLPYRGELWWCELPEVGRRPVVVLSRGVATSQLCRALVAPCTTIIRGLPSELVLEPEQDGVPQRCAVNLDAVESVSTAALAERLGRLNDRQMRQIDGGLELAVDPRVLGASRRSRTLSALAG